MTAPFGFDLVLKVNAGGSGLHHFANCSSRIIPAGVGVHEQRQSDSLCDPADIYENVLQRRQADIRDSVRSIRDACAREINSFEPALLRQDCGISIDCPGNLERGFGGEHRAKTTARVSGFRFSGGLVQRTCSHFFFIEAFKFLTVAECALNTI
jgi:hypothetical protein